VTTELNDGRIFTAYFSNADGGSAIGGNRFIAGGFFPLERTPEV
jgi:hypothetical protein